MHHGVAMVVRERAFFCPLRVKCCVYFVPTSASRPSTRCSVKTRSQGRSLEGVWGAPFLEALKWDGIYSERTLTC